MGKLRRRMVGVTALVAAVSSPCAVALASPVMTSQEAFNILMHSWVGTWSCTESMTNTKTVQWTATVTAFGDKWIKFAGVYPATKTQPPSAYESVFGYDSKRHQWVTVTFIADGTYGIDRGTSGQNAMTVTWVNAYPIESRVPATQVMTKHGFTVDGNYKEGGKPISFHWNCVKQ